MTRGTRYNPTTHALALGLHLIEHPLPDGECAHYFADERTIIIRPGLDVARRRTAVAHEVQHALAGDECCGGPGDTSAAEMAARAKAARMLVTIPDFAVARWMHGNDVDALAESLIVSASLLRDWFQFVAPAAGVRQVA